MSGNVILVRDVFDFGSAERHTHDGPIIDFLQERYPRGWNGGQGRVWLNGEELAVADYDTPVTDDDFLVVAVVPGEPGSLTAYVIAQIVIALVTAAITFLLTPKPSDKKSAAAQRVYDIANAQNQPALGSVIPEHYGKCWFFPSLASQPYSYYEGNIQYLNQLLLIGAGEYEIRQVQLGTTAIGSFPPGNINLQTFGPADLAPGFGTIFDATGIYEDVFTSVEVQGIDLAMNGAASWFGKTASTTAFNGSADIPPLFAVGLQVYCKGLQTTDANQGKTFTIQSITASGITVSPAMVNDGKTYQLTLLDYDSYGWRGWYEVSRDGQDAFAVAIDIVFPNGIFAVNNDGALINSQAEIEIEIEEIVAGTPTSTFATYTKVYTAATRTPQRFTLRYDVTPGRYRVRVRRMDQDDAKSQRSTACAWAALKGFIQHPAGQPVYGDVTILALRTRATAQVSDNSSNRISVQAVRLLPTVESDFANIQATINPVDAFAHVAMSGGATVDGLDMADLKVLAGRWAQTNGFNYRFEDATTVYQALQIIAASHRAIPSAYGYELTMRLNRAIPFDSFLVSDEQYVEDSFKQTIQLAPNDQVDGLRLSYGNPDAPGELTVLWPTTAVQPENRNFEGCTYQPTALAQAKFLWALRNASTTVIEFETEYDAHNFAVGERIAAPVTFIDWVETGRVMAIDGLALTLDITPKQQGASSVRLRSQTGVASNVLSATVADNVVTLAAVPPFDLFTPLDGQEGTTVVIGEATQVYKSYVVNEIEPGADVIRVSASLYSDAPYIYPIPGEDGIDPPPTDPGLPNPDDPTPVILLPGGSIEGYNTTAPGGNTAGMTFNPDGTITATAGGDDVTDTITGQRWITGAPDQTYQVFATVVARREGAFLSYAGPVGVWTALSAAVGFEAILSKDNGIASQSLVFQIRRASDQVVVMNSASPYTMLAGASGGGGGGTPP